MTDGLGKDILLQAKGLSPPKGPQRLFLEHVYPRIDPSRPGIGPFLDKTDHPSIAYIHPAKTGTLVIRCSA